MPVLTCAGANVEHGQALGIFLDWRKVELVVQEKGEVVMATRHGQ